MKDDVDDEDAGTSSSATVPETIISYGNPRESRNKAEKQRRDNLNSNISAMATLVPTVAESPRKMDKISILRQAVAFLRMDYAVGRGSYDFLPRELGDLDLEQYIVDNFMESGCFIIVITTKGKIVYVSRQVEQHLGHTRPELFGQSMENFVHPEDQEELTKNLTPDEMHGALVSSSSTTIQNPDMTSENSSSSEDSMSRKNERKPFHEQRRSFEMRMLRRTVSKQEHPQYEWLQVSGILRLADALRCSNEAGSASRRHREMSWTSNDVVFVGVAQLMKKQPITGLSILDANKSEYVTRHLPDGRIIYCDHRISQVAGYLSNEVSGRSAFSFMHKEDVTWPLIALRQMYDRVETSGTSCYRLLSKTGGFIHLLTRGFLEFDNNVVVSVVCINSLVSQEEGEELRSQMKERFSAMTEPARAMIQSVAEKTSSDVGSDSQLSNSKSSVDDPSQLENAITHLISDLPSPSVSEGLSLSPLPCVPFVKSAASQSIAEMAEKFDPYSILRQEGNRSSKQDTKNDNSKRLEQQARSKAQKQDKSRYSGKNLTSRKIINPTYKAQQDATRALATSSEPGTSYSLASDPIQRKDDPPSRENRSFREQTSLKLEQVVIKRFQKRELRGSEYLEGAPTIDTGALSDAESSNSYSLKRICSDENLQDASFSKKRHSEEQQGASRDNCRPLVKDEEFPGISTEYRHYDTNITSSQSINIVDSPNSSLNEDYQALDPSVSLVNSIGEEEPFGNLRDFKDDPLLSPMMDTNPDFFMKIYDDIRTRTIFDKTFGELKDNNALNNELRRTHRRLANSMVLQQSEINILERDLENPALQGHREDFTQIQAEHNMQRQILQSLQQEHHQSIQMNMRHNIGV